LPAAIKANKNTKFNKILRIAGYIITAVSIGYIVWIGYKRWNNIAQIFSFKDNWPGIAYSVIFYTLFILLIVFGWKIIENSLGGELSFKNSFTIYGRTHIARYIPGNVFHFVGRHILSKDIGIPVNIVLNGIFIEALLMIIGTGLLLLPSLIIYGTQKIAFLSTNRIILTVLLIVLFVIIIGVCLKFIPSLKTWLIKKNLLVDIGKIKIKKVIGSAIIVTIIYLFYHSGISLMLVFLTNYFWALKMQQLIIFIGAYSLGWLVGFITPGAPGGLGVREAIIVALLSPYLTQPRALVIALIFRIISIMGDFLFFTIAYSVNYVSVRRTGNLHS
jgi:glycosyltransferase 2 family protein